ncbi:morphogenetic protein [Providencia sp. R33]|uniref:morphogenetic protein n=1 Tax=Providencia sp. R33 TaxID=2828763 RepID=UPI001C5AE023|nr:morphogenetic protein [Providencia sp. R33]QXX84277.1 morphogenetic protein [Providencia sp. R33]
MKERGIIFNSEMVRAILDGRKTQTRRIINPQPELTQKSGFKWKGGLFGAGSDDRETNRNFAHKKCPLGKVGDRLWVRETWQGPLVDEDHLDNYRADADKFQTSEFCEYAADGGYRPEFCDLDGNIHYGWKPSSNMPRWASRITLEITDVRVERLQSISEEDAKAEGFDNSQSDAANSIGWFEKPVRAFRRDWENINGTDGWDSNPWVWVIEFKRV